VESGLPRRPGGTAPGPSRLSSFRQALSWLLRAGPAAAARGAGDGHSGLLAVRSASGPGC